MKPFDWTQLLIGRYKVYTQLVFWVIVLCLYIVLKEYPPRMTGVAIFCMVLQETIELAVPCYTQNLLVLPFFRRRQWVWGISLYLLQIVLLVQFLPYLLNGMGLVFKKVFHITDVVTDWQNQHFTFSMVAFTVIASLTKTGIDRLALEKQQKENEMRHLKAQLNPHFLFNTLNNLYGLAVSESKKLPDLMLKLSELLRYSLYDTNQHYVAVQKEVDYIRNYVELERIRLPEQTDIQLTISGDCRDQYIAPLLLIIFIENSFKHFSAAREQQAFVHIQLAIQNGHLTLEVQNSVDADDRPRQRTPDGGLGLNNVRQRLDLIYPKQYNLAITRGNGYFETKLAIDLS